MLKPSKHGGPPGLDRPLDEIETSTPPKKGTTMHTQPFEEDPTQADADPKCVSAFSLEQLVAHKGPLVKVTAESKLSKALALMLANDYSQLPVMANDRCVKGVINWKTIGSKNALGVKCEYVKDYMERAVIMSSEESIFSAAASVSISSYVLVRGRDGTIHGIVTAVDFSEQFLALGEPFWLVGEIENSIRKLLQGKFTDDELAKAKHPKDENRIVKSINDLTFGEYLKLIEKPSSWQKLNLNLDRAVIVQGLQDVLEIRNRIMHFSPEGCSKIELEKLRAYFQFFDRLRKLGAIA